MSIKMAASWGNSVKNFSDNTSKIAKESIEETEDIVFKTTDIVFDEAVRLTPVGKTGNLKSKWESKKIKRKTNPIGIVSNPLKYAFAVEYGSKTNKPNRMLTKAVFKGSTYMQKRLDKYGKKLEIRF